MIGFVVVSHSEPLAVAAVDLAMQMIHGDAPPVRVAAGADGGFGTDAVAIAAAIDELAEIDGVLILTDLYGASPSNLAAKLSRLGTPARRVSALNLPMLMRVMNYAELPLEELPAVAAAGARNGVIHDDA